MTAVQYARTVRVPFWQISVPQRVRVSGNVALWVGFEHQMCATQGIGFPDQRVWQTECTLSSAVSLAQPLEKPYPFWHTFGVQNHTLRERAQSSMSITEGNV